MGEAAPAEIAVDMMDFACFKYGYAAAPHYAVANLSRTCAEGSALDHDRFKLNRSWSLYL